MIPTALTALAATVLSTYNYKSDHVRQGLTHDALQGELAKFCNEAAPYNSGSSSDNVGHFLAAIRSIISNELSAWRDEYQKQSNQCQNQPHNLRPDNAAGSQPNRPATTEL